MEKKEFDELIQRVKEKKPKIFGLEADEIPTVTDIEKVEEYYKIVFPKSYKEFVLQYGGGYFAFTVVYSFDKQSLFYIKNNVTTEFVNTNQMFPVIDFETGDIAGFRIKDGICEDSMMLYNHEEKMLSELRIDLYETLVKYGLKL